MSILSNIQSQIKAEKNLYNSFGKYKYRNAESILEALKPLLAKHQYSVIITDEIVNIGDRFFVKATVTMYDDKMQLVVHNSAFAGLPLSQKGMGEAQITGASSSYAKKYALGAMFLLDDSKDDDSIEAQKIPMVNDEQIKYIYTMISTKGIDKEAVKKAYSVASMNDLTSEQALKLIAQLKSK